MKVVLPEGIKSIGSKAFVNSSVSEINLPFSLVSIANDALPTDKVFLTVKATKGTYAYQWAVNQGHIHTFSMSPVTQTNVPAAGDIYFVYLRFKGNYAQYARYKFMSNASWLIVDDISSLGGSVKTLKVTVNPNPNTFSRTTTVTVTCGQEKSTYTLTQNGASQTTFTVSPTRQTEVPAVGGTYSLKLIFTGDDALYDTDINVPWLTMKPETIGGSTKIFSVIVQPNTESSSRTATVTFTYGQQEKTYQLTQNGAPVCSHLNSDYHGTYDECIRAYDNGNDLHTAIYVTKHAYTCRDCGKAWVTVDKNAWAVVEPHNPGKKTICMDCGASVHCIHNSAQDVYQSDICIRVYDNGNGTHTRVLVTSHVYECSSCGLTWELFESDERTYINNHSYNGDDQCTTCKAHRANINKTTEPPVYIFDPGTLGPGFPPVPL